MLIIKRPKAALIGFNNEGSVALGDIDFHEGAFVQNDNRYDNPVYRIETPASQASFFNDVVYDTNTGEVNPCHFTAGFKYKSFSNFESNANSELIVPFLVKAYAGNNPVFNYGVKLKFNRNSVDYENGTHGFGGYVTADMYMENNVERSMITPTSININGVKEVVDTKAINTLGLYHDDNIIWQLDPLYFETSTGAQVYTDQNYSNTIIERTIGDLYSFKQDVSVKKQSNSRIDKVYYRNDVTGLWLLDIDQRILDRWNDLPVGSGFSFRLVIVTSKWNKYNSLSPIPKTFIDGLYFRKTLSCEEIAITQDNTTVTYKFDAPCYVSAYLNNELIADKLLSTINGEITINFGKDLKTGNTVELRTFTYNETVVYNSYIIEYKDTIAPPPVEANRFIANRIYGTGGEAGAFAVALRNDVEIGRVIITGSLEFIMQLNTGITLNTGDLVELYAEDSDGNKSESELYEVEVSPTTDGLFTQSMGNDTLIAKIVI